MSTTENPTVQEFAAGLALADVLADVAEVFAESVNHDGLETLLHACMTVAQIDYGRVQLDDGRGGVEMMIESRSDSDDGADRSLMPSSVMARALSSLRPEVDPFDARGVAHGFPLRVRGRAIGAIELVESSGSAVHDTIRGVVQSLADIAAVAIDRVRVIEQTSRLVSQLQNALESRVVLEQAKGVLAERLGTDCPAAFREIRNTARREQKPIGEIAATILKGRTGVLR